MKVKILALLIKEQHGCPMSNVPEIELIEGFGIKGDINANVLSPRQVLITRKEDLDNYNIPHGGLRENIIIEGIETNNFKPGNVLKFDNVDIRLTFNCEPCKRISDYVKPSDIIGKRGILGVVIKGGFIHVGMSGIVLASQYEPMSDLPFDRFNQFIKKIPKGKIVTYKEVVLGMGVAESYLRAIPTYIGKADDSIPVHRIVDSSGDLILKYVVDQRQKLIDESVAVQEIPELFGENKYSVNVQQYLWKNK